MNKNKQHGRKGWIILLVIVALCICLIFAAIFFGKPSLKKGTATYHTRFYEAVVPEGWEIEQTEYGITGIFDIFTEGDKKICTIEAGCFNFFCDSTSQLIDALYGMRGSAKDGWKEEVIGGWKRIEVTICYSQSPAEEIEGIEAMPDELHYIYTDGKSILIDICMDTEMAHDEKMEDFLDSLQIVWS